MTPDNEFMECDACRGTPGLCAGCLHNRGVIFRLNREVHRRQERCKTQLGEISVAQLGEISRLVEEDHNDEDVVAAVRRVVEERDGLNKAVDELAKRYDESQRMLRARKALVEEIEDAGEALKGLNEQVFTVLAALGPSNAELEAEVKLAQDHIALLTRERDAALVAAERRTHENMNLANWHKAIEDHRTARQEAHVYIETLEAMLVACLNEVPEPRFRAARLVELEALKKQYRDNEK